MEHPGSGLSYVVDNLRYTSVRTNLANEKTLTTEGREAHHDVNLTDNGDGTVTLQVAMSNSIRTYDDSGQKVDHEASRLVLEFLIDYNGTPFDPSDDVESFVGVVKDQVGYTSDVDWCNLVHDALE